MLVDEPLISVIIPFYNRIDKLILTLNSVLLQSYKNYEILLIDDCSFEDISKINNFLINDNIFYYRNLINSGPGFSRNFALEKARGEYIAFLDSDDLWLQDKLKIQIQYMISKNINFCHTSYIKKINTHKKNINFNTGFINYFYPLPLFTCHIAMPTVIIKKSILNNLNFQNDLRFMEDTFFWYQLSKKTLLYGLNKKLSVINTNINSSYLNKKMIINARKQIKKKLYNENYLIYCLFSLYLKIRNIINL